MAPHLGKRAGQVRGAEGIGQDVAQRLHTGGGFEQQLRAAELVQQLPAEKASSLPPPEACNELTTPHSAHRDNP